MIKSIETDTKGYKSLSSFGLSAYKINIKKGLIIHATKILGSLDGKKGHLRALLTNDDGTKEYYHIYKLIWCYAHDEMEIPIGYKLIHINDDRTDNRLINLQLIKLKGHTTRGDNITKYICLKNINTQEVIKFKTLDEAVDYTGLYKKHFYKSAILQEPLSSRKGDIFNLFIETIKE